MSEGKSETTRKDGYYWIQYGSEEPVIAEWHSRHHGWQLFGMICLDEDEANCLAGPMLPPRTLAAPVGNYQIVVIRDDTTTQTTGFFRSEEEAAEFAMEHRHALGLSWCASWHVALRPCIGKSA